MKKDLLRRFVPVILIALLAAACGGSADSEPAAVADVEPTEGEAAPTEPPTTAPVPTEPPATATPEPEPTPEPTEAPTPEPEPTPEPTPEPEPTEAPTPEPTEAPGDDADNGGSEDPDAADEPAAEPTAPPAVDGGAVFAGSCAGCHGADGTGTDQGPNISTIGQFFTSDVSPLTNLVTNGGQFMPEFGTKLSAEQIDAVVQYVVETFQ